MAATKKNVYQPTGNRHRDNKGIGWIEQFITMGEVLK
jgi:hypothetical protein